ncbi:MAG: HAMP domain-containing histidine kinase [Magnetococcales bacterium]|nr:HAMP domain-containing histidine kinase [Magnetococcales bacterium]
MVGLSPGQRDFLSFVWRRTSLTLKAGAIMALVGGVFLVLVDLWQTGQISAVFRERLLQDLEIQAQRDRLLFDGHIRAQKQSIQLFAQRTALARHVESRIPAWEQDPRARRLWSPREPPPWLPSRSVLRGLIAAPYMVLLDQERRVREIWHRDGNLAELPETLLTRLGSEQVQFSESTHILAVSPERLYLLSIGPVQIGATPEPPLAYMVWVAPLDDDFLSIFHTTTETGNLVALIHGETRRVLASSKPERIAAGMPLETLESRYMVFGKLLDYGASITIPLRFVSLVPLEEIETVSQEIIETIQKQFIVGYAVLAVIFLLLIILIIKKVQRFTEDMVKTAVSRLELKTQTIRAGDQLLMMREQFQWMTTEILEARQRDLIRREELQLANASLQRSLVMIKRTNEQLVEAERMAALGSMVAGVAHEINTPVGTGVTAASFLEGRCQACGERFEQGTLTRADMQAFLEDVRESSRLILRNLLRAAELVRSFKQVAVDRSQEERRTFLLHETIRHILRSLQGLPGRPRHRIQVECPEELLLDSYPGAIARIVTNLIVNSYMHAFGEDEHGEIHLRAIRQGEDVLLRYSDNGRGMAEKDRQQIFTPFFTTARHRGGVGLGLHIVYNLVTQTLGGTIRCISSPGEGTSYEILLPQRE